MTFVIFHTSAAAILLGLLSLYRLANKATLASFASSFPGILFLGSLIVLVLSMSWIVYTFRVSSPYERKQLAMALGMNLLALALTAGSAEMFIRLLSIQTPGGPIFLGTVLYPKSWSNVVAHHRPVLEKMSQENTFLVHDQALGWTVAPNRRDSSGLYASSAEGLRSTDAGKILFAPPNYPSGSADRRATIRIALVGDSMTFGNEVEFQKTWGHLLQQQLGPKVQILNFSVPAYGISQMFLHYQMKVRSWHPDIVIIGITSYTIHRMMNIYNFLIDPGKTYLPFVRPRLMLQNDNLISINQPLPTPAEIFSRNLLSDLPHIEHDRYYSTVYWEHGGGWRFLEASYLFRFLNSIRPPSAEHLRAEVSDDVKDALGKSILKALIGNVQADGATPFVINLPYQWELRVAVDRGSMYVPPGAQMLHSAGIDFYDATQCLIEAKMFDSFEQGGHYGTSANAAIANCLGMALQNNILRENG